MRVCLDLREDLCAMENCLKFPMLKWVSVLRFARGSLTGVVDDFRNSLHPYTYPFIDLYHLQFIDLWDFRLQVYSSFILIFIFPGYSASPDT